MTSPAHTLLSTLSTVDVFMLGALGITCRMEVMSCVHAAFRRVYHACCFGSR